jgi:hypothetical protein
MTAQHLSAIVILTGLVLFSIFLISFNIISLNHRILVMAQTDDSTGSSFSFSLGELFKVVLWILGIII